MGLALDDVEYPGQGMAEGKLSEGEGTQKGRQRVENTVGIAIKASSV